MFNPKKIIHMPYYYVPVCPKCGSPITGRYIKNHRLAKDDADVVMMSLKNGEIVDFLPEVLDANAFCLTCGHKWYADITCEFLSLESIEKEKKMRGTNELLAMKMRQDREEKKRQGFVKLGNQQE